MTTEVETGRVLAGWIEQAADLEELYRGGGAVGWGGVELPFELADAALACRHNDMGLSVLALRASCTEVKISAAKTQVLEMLELGGALGVRSLNLAMSLAQVGAAYAGFDRYRAALNFCFELLAVSYSEAEAAGVDLAVEVPAVEALHSPVELAELLDVLPTAAVGVCLADARFARRDALPDWLATLGRRVFSLRLTQGADDYLAHDSEGEPSPHLVSLRQVLDHIDYQGLIITPLEAAAALRGMLLPAGGD